MGLFSTILSKLGLGKPATPPPAPAAVPPPPMNTVDKGEKDNLVKPVPAAPTPVVAPPPAPSPTLAPAAMPSPVMAAPPKPTVAPMAEVDVVKKLESLSAGSGLDWKVSIVDLLKLLDIDSSRQARNELATELGCPAELMSDSAKMNVWLHKTVLQKIAENGGNIPKELLS